MPGRFISRLMAKGGDTLSKWLLCTREILNDFSEMRFRNLRFIQEDYLGKYMRKS